MNSENNNKVVWTRVREVKSQSEPTLIGIKLAKDWLESNIPVMEVRFGKELERAFKDLFEAGSNVKKRIPIRALRVALIGAVDRVISVEQDLGIGKNISAITALPPIAEDEDNVRSQIIRELRLWLMNTVEPWAESNGFGDIAARIKPLIVRDLIELSNYNRPLIGNGGMPDYVLIARLLGEKLIGENLFAGLSECEIVATQNATNKVDLMTLPSPELKSSRIFSMVCRLAVCSIPFSSDIYVSVTAMKRVWANRVPGIRYTMPYEITGYVISANRPIIEVPVSRKDSKWDFSDGYSALKAQADNNLPENLQQAIAQQEFNAVTNWWSGIPELKTLFSRVSSSTVFESDEVDLLKKVNSLLGSALSGDPINIKEIPLIRAGNKTKQEMLKISDLDTSIPIASAGESLIVESEDALDNNNTKDEDAESRLQKLVNYREQNQKALTMAGGHNRLLWVIGGSPDEQETIRKSAAALFGDAIEINTEPLPIGTHGLQKDLELPDGKSRERFEQRVKSWNAVTPQIKSLSKDQKIFVLICAPDTVGNKPEDQVNYYAGIHALSSINANIHHLLPTENPEDPKSRQHFLHRAQSALLDVFLAHSGVVLNTHDFISRLYPVETAPKMVFGIQALRSNARSHSGESRVCFIIYSRLIVATGITEINIAYKEKTKNNAKTLFSGWKPLATSLQWIGAQRNLNEGNEAWLKDSFIEVTRDAISEMQVDDPNGIIMIEWGSVRGLWKGINDESLKGGVAKLGDIPLSSFKHLSFVRLRNGSDTISLREGSKTNYTGTENGKPNGEILIDSYYTTGKKLVEVVNDCVKNNQIGHFIATMGYAKTVQIKRGFSCYRSMPRVQKIEGLSEYKQILLDPGSMDASLPSSMDITVLYSPIGAVKENIAMTVMGLRLGYAHYSDWTRLPAPLFFRSKIEDYIIRFPDSEDEERSATVISEDAASEEDSHQISQLEMFFNQDEIEKLQPGAVTDSSQDQIELNAEKSIEELNKEEIEVIAEGLDDDINYLLTNAKSSVQISLSERENGHLPLYRRMFQNVQNDVQIHVTLPYWLKTNDLFGLYSPKIRRMSSRVWEALRDMDYVRRYGVTKPADVELLNWLSNKLKIPQAINGILHVTRAIDSVEFQPFSTIIENDFNAHSSEEEKLNPREVLHPEVIKTLTKWANANNHDEMMGWIIFTVAQFGNPKHCEIVMSEITHVTGPRTEDALRYYIACSEAIKEALAADSRKRISIVKHRKPHPEAEAFKKKEMMAKTEMIPIIEPSVTESAESVHTPAINSEIAISNQKEESLVMIVKNKLVELIQQLAPGTDEFEMGIAAINGAIEELSSIHRVAMDQLSAESILRDKFEALRLNCVNLITALDAVKDDLELDDYIYSAPEEEKLYDAVDQINIVNGLLDDFNTLNTVLNEFEKLPPATSVVERAKHTNKVGETLNAIVELNANIKSRLYECICLVSRNDSPPPNNEIPLNDDAPGENNTMEKEQVDNFAEPSVVESVAAMIHTAELAISGSAYKAADITSDAESEISKQVQEVVTLERQVENSVTVTHLIEQIEHRQKPLTHENEEDKDTDFSELDKSIMILEGLINQRYYGLAEVHVEALKFISLVEKDGTSGHYTILNALVKSLFAMDCQFDFDNGIDSALSIQLESTELPAGNLCESQFTALGIMAASMSSLLFAAPDVQWKIGSVIASRLQGYKALSSFIQHIDEVRRQGLVVTRDMYLSSHIGEKSAIEIELTRFKKRAEEWKEGHETFNNWNHRGYRKLHDEIFGVKNSVGECLSLIAKGDHVRAKASYEVVRKSLAKPSSIIDEGLKKVGERIQIDGLYRDRTVENLEKTKAFIENYLEYVSRRENPKNELNRNVQNFLTSLHKCLNDSHIEIASIKPSTNLERLYCNAASIAICSALKLFDNALPPICIPQDKQKLLIQLPMGRDLIPVLEPVDANTPALVTPAEVFSETARWVNEKLRMDDSGDSIDAALKESMRMHLDNKRFIPAWRISKILNGPDNIAHEYSLEKNAFKARLQEAKQRVTHAMTLSALQQDEANSMQRIIDKMLSGVQAQFGIGHPDGDPSIVADFQQAIASLSSNVTKQLHSRLSEAASDLKTRLADYAEKNGSNSISDVNRIHAIIGDGSNAANLRTAFDAMVMLNANHSLPKHLGKPIDGATEYDEFMRKVNFDIGNDKRPLYALQTRLQQAPQDDEPQWLHHLSIEAREEGATLIKFWTEMFTKGDDRFDDKRLTNVLKLIGINHETRFIHEPGGNNRIKFFLNERAFTFPTSPMEDFFIPPVLGSWATHIEGYLITGTPQESDLRQAMIGIGSTPTLIFCRSRLNMVKRARISENLPVILVDDDLIAYLALHQQEKLHHLMRVSMLTFSTNPYDDYGVRPVPTEMFFGRQRELSKLRDVKSVGVLYGGRRLGKSSLLAQIVQENEKVLGSKAVYISMENITPGPDYLDSAWEYLYFALVKKNVIQASNTVRGAKSFKNWIEKELSNRTDLKSLYLLIDEADTLMGCELRGNSVANGFVQQLVNLIDSVHSCKVRYVIAGLHNMTRMATEENSVFGKIEPIALEPFNTLDDFQRGISLITKPMAAMGFLFPEDKQDLPLRILSVCNFYPAFIQLYCKRLVDRLQNNRQNFKPPMYISEQDLDAVENDDSLLSELRGKFELNLNLDKRYKAIALILADIYYTDSDKGQHIGLSVSEIREYCESFCGEHFAHTGAGTYEALLDEMVKLNVLERINGSRYLLRNPNIAMMIGDRDRVNSKLDELSREKANADRNHGEKRIPMRLNNSTMTFPMPIGWIRSQIQFTGNKEETIQDGELIILTGNKLSGLEEAVLSMGRDEWTLGHGVVVSAMLGSGPEAASEYINKTRRGTNTSGIKRLMLVRSNSWNIRQITDFANVASKAAKQGVRIALIAPPDRSFELAMSIDRNEIKPGMTDESRGWNIVAVPVWSEDAIYFYMSENANVSEVPDALNAIREATCGFGKEVLNLCRNNLQVKDALMAPKVNGARLASSIKVLYDNVGMPASYIEDRRRNMEMFLPFIDGIKRNSSDVIDYRKDCNISQGEMDFMTWMGLLQSGENGTWRVPYLYRQLLNN